MQLRDLACEGRPAFPPSWKDPQTGSEPLRHQPLAGILIEVEWGRHNLSLELTNYWRGRRLRGRLLTDDATVLPRIHAMLSASVPRHLDELIDMEIPPAVPSEVRRRPEAPVELPSEPTPSGPSSQPASMTPPLHPDVALLVATLIRKGILSAADLEATRRSLAEPPVSGTPSVSPRAARLPNFLEALNSDSGRLTPRK
jgi:hypothetical protein